MPGGFNNTSARKYLESRWGLASGRQDAVLLHAITSEPPSRLPSEAEAKSFLDSVAHSYAASTGITLSTPSAGSDSGSGAGGGMMVDPAALEALTADQRAFFKQQLEITARYLKLDLRAGDKAYLASQQSHAALQAQLDLWQAEHGDFYAAGIEPSFDPLKARTYDSYWNWARQDALNMYYDIIFGRLTTVDREIVSQCIRLMNRSNPLLVDFMQYHIDNCPTERGETYKLAKELAQQLIDNCNDVLQVDPVYKDVAVPTAPETIVDPRGNISYSEVPRPHARKLEHYVTAMAEGGPISEYSNRTKVQNDLKSVYKLIKKQHRLSKSSQLEFNALYKDVLRSLSMNQNQILQKKGRGRSASRARLEAAAAAAASSSSKGSGKVETIPFLHLKKKFDHGWEYSKKLSNIYLN
ncbi:3-oxoacyl-[acyl-carrier-protein] synthase, partial [Ascosphaera atra]